MYIRGGGGPFLCLGAPLAGVRVLDQQAPDPFILSGDPSRVRPCRLDLKLSVFQAFCGKVRLEQVIALETDFALLTRVWCVAELVEANELHLQQAPRKNQVFFGPYSY